MTDQKVSLLFWMWTSPGDPFRWLPNWERTYKTLGYRFRVIKWGWWAVAIRLNRKAVR